MGVCDPNDTHTMPGLAKFYTVLGLTTQNPSEKELKSAYKKAALKHHPDRNPKDKEGAEKRFKECAEAYSVLSDPKKKQVYDVYGEEGLKAGGGAPPPQQGDFNMGGGGGFHPGMFNMSGRGGGNTFVFTSSGGGGG